MGRFSDERWNRMDWRRREVLRPVFPEKYMDYHYSFESGRLYAFRHYKNGHIGFVEVPVVMHNGKPHYRMTYGYRKGQNYVSVERVIREAQSRRVKRWEER
jgi:hypothetical protein